MRAHSGISPLSWPSSEAGHRSTVAMLPSSTRVTSPSALRYFLVGAGSAPSYPPCKIERNGENAFRISVAVAGFTDADLSIELLFACR